MNRIILIGRITKDLELSRSKDKEYCKFSLAVNRGYTKQVDFINCIAWENLANNLVKYQSKGNLIAVSGSLFINNYTDKDGFKRVSAEVNVNELEFLERKKEAETPTTSLPIGNEEEIKFKEEKIPVFNEELGF